MKRPSIIWAVVENLLVVIVAFLLFFVASSAFENVALAILILVYAEVRRSRLLTVDTILQGTKQYVHLLKVVETTFLESSKQNAYLAKVLKDPDLTVDDIPDYEKTLDLSRSLEDVDSVAENAFGKVKIVLLIEQACLCILCLLAVWKILRSIL